MKIKIVTLWIILLALAVGTGWAQAPHREGVRNPDPLRQHLFPPDLVMRHQQTIGLTDAQRKSIISEMEKSQGSFVKLQWGLHRETEAMASVVQQDPVDVKKALAQVDKILDLERKVKRTRMTMLLRIKNILTREQKQKLTEIKEHIGPKPFQRPGSHGPRAGQGMNRPF